MTLGAEWSMSKIRMPNTSKPIRHAGAIGAAPKQAVVSAAAPEANRNGLGPLPRKPDGMRHGVVRGSISNLDARQSFVPVDNPVLPVLQGLAAQSAEVAAAEVAEPDEG